MGPPEERACRGVGVILAIETAVERVGVAVGDNSGVRASAMLTSDRRHAESLAPMIDFVLSQASLRVDEIDHIAVDVGPGLFTGMRVGMATAQTMAWALDVPLVPVSSLDAIAFGFGASEDPVAVALDARRGEVYWALYRGGDGTGEPAVLKAPSVTVPSSVAIDIADRGEMVTCVGTGFVRYRDDFASIPGASFAPSTFSMPRAEDVLGLATLRVARDRVVAADALEPMYLRAPDAEINWRTRDGAA
ncbi:MAG: tRNA ((37)-N6)-threonylcarbamoyltransferase complex dimerization subunit type 1 TsaB [Actinomycetota bacterium]|jgi:tRNA threonylcarbamoyladenosine biosynthesis protein TsaB